MHQEVTTWRSSMRFRLVSFAVLACIGFGFSNDCSGQTTFSMPSDPSAEQGTLSGQPISFSETGSEFNAEMQSKPILKNNNDLADLFASGAEQLTESEGTQSSVKIALLLGALGLAPAIVLMSTCYVRLIIVFTLLRQAFGAQQLPPTQVITSLSLFLTLLIMAPIWNQIKNEAIDPYISPTESFDWQSAWERGVVPVKDFMRKQIKAAGNTESVALFYNYIPEDERPNSLDEVPLNVLLPAFMISELKVAFLMGFQIYLPFLVVDLVVSSVTVSMGMLMLPPTVVSFPLKLILFVMVDGWNLVVGMLLQSFGPPPF